MLGIENPDPFISVSTRNLRQRHRRRCNFKGFTPSFPKANPYYVPERIVSYVVFYTRKTANDYCPTEDRCLKTIGGPSKQQTRFTTKHRIMIHDAVSPAMSYMPDPANPPATPCLRLAQIRVSLRSFFICGTFHSLRHLRSSHICCVP